MSEENYNEEYARMFVGWLRVLVKIADMVEEGAPISHLEHLLPEWTLPCEGDDRVRIRDALCELVDKVYIKQPLQQVNDGELEYEWIITFFPHSIVNIVLRGCDPYSADLSVRYGKKEFEEREGLGKELDLSDEDKEQLRSFLIYASLYYGEQWS